MYICYEACKESLKLCRHVIGLDGFFLKGLSGGQILAAMDRDRNDQMLPIAMAVIEGENMDSWTWFSEPLIDDLEGRNEFLSYTFISCQQKVYKLDHFLLLLHYFLLCKLDNFLLCVMFCRASYLQWKIFFLMLNKDYV